MECRNPNGLNRDVTDDGYCYAGADVRGESDDIPIEYFESGGK